MRRGEPADLGADQPKELVVPVAAAAEPDR